ncbi:MAG: radical SAM protein [Magnetococcales bacterium]|nr:radical SAM protein [Magnetococcales bacterium]
MSRFIRNVTVLSRLGLSILHAKLLSRRRPVFVGLYITNRCNLSCRYCFANVDARFTDPTHPPGLPREEVFRYVDELYDMGMRWVFLLGGEPLMHPHIGAIVRHIVDKGILLHILTNGTLIERRLDDIAPADGICVSIDGTQQATDAMRGKDAYRRAMNGARAALDRGMKTRIHAVLNKESFGDMEALAVMAREMGLSISLSPLNYLGEGGKHPEASLTREEYQEFYRRYRQLKADGYPINNSFYAIDKTIGWPIDYHEYLKPGQQFPGYEPIPCVIGQTHGCIDADGILFNCIQRGCLDGLKINEVGMQAAWDELPRRRQDCVSCASINTIETSAYLSLKPAILLDGLRFFFGKQG